ncbi:MAG: PTS sugar transporter subunit IIC [Phocaeicola plebeius]|nr:PTS sugar transporter subunit IIC [Phocaeicola plebeius]
MEQVFSYIIGLGAAVMMPIIFTILGVCIGIKFGKALKSGLLVGVGFVGLSVVTALLTSSLGPALSKVVEIYGLQLKVFDMGWPAAAAVAYNTSVGAFIIPVCLGVNLLMLLTKTTRTVNIDLWNYWHFAFIGAVVYFASGNIWWGFFAAIICYIITLIMADLTAKQFQGYYDKMEGISIPQPFCQGFVPFALLINKGLDFIPGFDKLNIDAEGMKKKFGIMGEPLFLGILVGCGIGALACKNGAEVVDKIPNILGLGIKMGAVMELIPRITALFIEGLRPISDATRELIAKKFKGNVSLHIGMSPALVIGHPTTLVVSLLLIPVTLLLAVALPGNEFLPLASLAGMFYLFPMVLPITKGNVLKTFIVGLVVIVIGLLFVTDLAPYFTQAAHDAYEVTVAKGSPDGALKIPDGFEGGALDFASSPFAWVIFHLVHNLKWIGSAALVACTLGLAVYNRRRILMGK